MVTAAAKNRLNGEVTRNDVPSLHRSTGRFDPISGQQLPKTLFRSLVHRDRTALEKNFSAVEKAAMDEHQGMLGGYLVPQQYSYALFEAIAEHSFIEPRAFVQDMTNAELLLPAPNVVTGSAGVSPFFGGITFGWGQSVPPNQIADASGTSMFREARLFAWDLIGTLVCSNQFLADLTDEGEEKLIRLFGRAAAWSKEYSFLRGTGTAAQQPLGILNAGCTAAVTRAGSGHIAQADVAGMAAKMIPFGWSHSIWACSPSALIDVVRITGWVPNEDPLGTELGCAGSLYSRPLFVTEKLPSLGTKGDLAFFDPSLYLVGNRLGAVIEVSPHPNFKNNQSIVKVWCRADGKPLLASTVTLENGDTGSAFVVLAT